MATEFTSSVEAPRRGERFYLHALVGAVVTVVTSFVPFAPVLGGAVAGYLQGPDTGTGTRVGAVSGLIASVPLAALFVVLFTVMSFGSAVSGEIAGPMFVVFLAGTVLLFAAVYTVGLSAVGGYLGAAVGTSRKQRRLSEFERTTTAADVAPSTERAEHGATDVAESETTEPAERADRE